jgi:hypothetical protein
MALICPECGAGFSGLVGYDLHLAYHRHIREAEERRVEVELGYVTKDSGERQQFDSGMVRDSQRSKTRYDLVYLPMLKRWADLMGRGADKYGERNWEKAEGEEELNRFKESAFRHFIQWFMEENLDEDHAAAILFNVSGAEYVKEKLDAKKTSDN